MDINKIKDEVYKEYKKNKYEESWNDPDKNGKEIAAIFSLSPRVIALAKEMEYMRDGERIKSLDLPKMSRDSFRKISSVAELCLIITEVAEAIEEVLAGRNADEERGDIVIRTMNEMSRNSKGNLETTIRQKHLKNMKREARHGRKV